MKEKSYKRTNDFSISPTDISTFEGKKVGGIRDNRITDWQRFQDSADCR